MAELNKTLLDILACPRCKKPVVQRNDTLVCQGTDCGLVYPIRNGIPVMLIDEATPPKPRQHD
jgi:uncharacterized protein YbaR (Trm112 family)